MKTDSVKRKQFFDERASTWNNGPNYLSEQERLGVLLKTFPIKSGARILDVGTGTGIALPALKEIAGDTGQVIGLDVSAAMVAEARKVHTAVEVGDAHELSFPDSRFDAVLAFAVIPHLDDPGRFLNEAARVLKPGGIVIILHFMSREICNDFHRKVGTAVEHDMLPAPEELGEMAFNSGLDPFRFEEADDLFLWIAEKHV